jgi:hypothetical protein
MINVIYRNLPSKVEEFLEHNARTRQLFESLIGDRIPINGDILVKEHLDPMIHWIYSQIEREVSANTLTKEGARFYIKEISVFARYNSQFLLRTSQTISGFCPEFAHELMRNHLEEGGDRGNLPAHYIILSSALLKDLDLMVNGYVPQAPTTRMLIWLHNVLANSHCPSTQLGMYYATEAVAISETKQLNQITDRLGYLLYKKTGEQLPYLNSYFKMHLDDEHMAATNGKAVERGHQDGIARFIRQYDLFHFQPALILDGFLQMLGPLVDQWTELHLIDRNQKLKQKEHESIAV